MLSKISQVVKDKYHMISPKWNLINKTNKQENITRDIKIKNNFTAIRGEVGGDNGGKMVKGFRNNYKGHMDKTKGG